MSRGKSQHNLVLLNSNLIFHLQLLPIDKIMIMMMIEIILTMIQVSETEYFFFLSLSSVSECDSSTAHNPKR